MFDLKVRDPKKQVRFRRPEFQEKLARARRFKRRISTQPEGKSGRFFVRLNLRSKLLRSSGIIFFLVVIYFLTLSKVFLVTQAEIQTPGISDAGIKEVFKKMEQERIYLVPSNHILILTKSKLLSALQAELPEIRQITSFQRIFPDKVKIALERREPLYVWGSSANYYLLDQDGVVFQKISNYSPTAYPETLIRDRTSQTVRVGEELPINKLLQFIRETLEQWPKIIRETEIASFSTPGTRSFDVFAKTAIGFEVYFDLERSVKVQLENLELVLHQEIKPETYNGLSYIDLRLPTTAYYCYKDAPCAPESATSTKQTL